MSLQPEKEKDLEVKIVPERTFAGRIDKPVFVKRGEVIPQDKRTARVIAAYVSTNWLTEAIFRLIKNQERPNFPVRYDPAEPKACSTSSFN